MGRHLRDRRDPVHPRPAPAPPSGRPSLGTKGQSGRVIARIPQALIDRTDRAAKVLASNRAQLIRLALERWLDQFDRGPDAPTIGATTGLSVVEADTRSGSGR